MSRRVDVNKHPFQPASNGRCQFAGDVYCDGTPSDPAHFERVRPMTARQRAKFHETGRDPRPDPEPLR